MAKSGKVLGRTGTMAAQGAAIGSLGGPLGTGIGAGIGALTGFFSSLFEDDDEEVMRKRKEELDRQIMELRAKTLSEGTRLINSQTSGLISNARASGAKQALAMGKSNDTQAFTLPAVAKIGESGANSLKNFVNTTDRYFNEQQLNADAGFANRPIAPSASDYLLEMGAAGAELAQNKQYIDMLGERGNRGNLTLPTYGLPQDNPQSPANNLSTVATPSNTASPSNKSLSLVDTPTMDFNYQDLGDDFLQDDFNYNNKLSLTDRSEIISSRLPRFKKFSSFSRSKLY